jgi:tRNA threonylcarbamoyladenosine biosynthesis protein TsaE
MAILNERTLDFTSNSVEQTVRLGVRLGELLTANDVICLSGELGTGKTALARGIGRGWGSTARVTSPTFTLIHEYARSKDGRILYHLDCYRLQHETDIETVGLEDTFDSHGPVMIEWPERIAAWLPEDRLWITLSYVNQTRRSMRFEAQGTRSGELLKEFKKSAFGV